MAAQNKSTDVLVVAGFAEALSAPEVIWSLADQGWKIVAFTRKGARSALRSSRYVSLVEIVAPETDCAQAAADLVRHISSLKQSNPGTRLVLMPLDDAAVWLGNRARPDANVLFAGPTEEAATLALNKAMQIDLAREAGFQAPATRQVEKLADVFNQPVEFPVVFKPVMAESEAGGKLRRGRAWTCSDKQELESAVKNWGGREPMLLQQYVRGVGEGMFGLASDGQVIGWSAHRRVRMMNPQGSGSSACISKDVDEGLKAIGQRFITLSGWRGLFMIELLRDESGHVWFMELNGRSWGSMALARRMGFEYPAWAVEKVLDPASKVEPPLPRPRPILCRHLGRELAHLLFVLRGPKSKALTAWPSRWSAARQVLSFHGDDRWYNWRGDDSYVFFRDTIATIKGQLFKSKGRA